MPKEDMRDTLKKPAPKPEKEPGPTSIRFTPEEHAELKQTARRLGITISDLVRWRNSHAKGEIETDIEPTGKNRVRI